MSPTTTANGPGAGWVDRYAETMMRTFATPRLVLVRGEGATLIDADGRRYLDLLAGIAVNSLGHAHPDLVAAVCHQIATLGHVSNYFATPPQVRLAERLLDLLGASPGGPSPGRVFFTNSGTEALEAAVKLTRRTGRAKIVAAENGFHGRTMGALSVTWKPAYREPFEPLPGPVQFVPYGDPEALAAAVDADTAAVLLEPIQGEAGVRPAPEGYLSHARAVCDRAGALLVLDEVQTGIGRTGAWFAHTRHGVRPDVITLAKGLGGGVPIGACIALGEAAGLLGPGQHGSTFGGNPLAATAGLTVLEVIARDGLLESTRRVGAALAEGARGCGHPLLAGVRGEGLLLGLALSAPLAPQLAAAALRAGYIVNDVTSDTIRLAPPLILRPEQAEAFIADLPALCEAATATEQTGSPS